MARLPELIDFAKEHGLKVGAIADLIHYRSQTETLVQRVAERQIQTAYGPFQLYAYQDETAEETHLVMVKGAIQPDHEVLVRVHEPVSLVDLLDMSDSAHSWPLPAAMKTIAEAGSGVIVLLHRPESGEELLHRLQSGTKPAALARSALRNYGIGAQILRDVGVRKMKLLAVERKMPSMTGFDLEVTGYLQPGQK